MPARDDAALRFLLTRRSRPAKTLGPPYPDATQLAEILTAAARTPDHGKLEPWRFVVLTGAALPRLAAAAEARGAALGLEATQIDKGARPYREAGCAVAVIAAPKPSAKVPEIEQLYSAGAVCLALLNAALAAGWGANWLSGWPVHDAIFVQDALGCGPGERVAGVIHLGTESAAPPERPRPDIAALTTWIDR